MSTIPPQIGGMREGDYLVAIGDRDVKWSSHADVVKEIKTAENTLRLRLVTPMDRSLAKTNYKEKASIKSIGGGSISPTSTTSSSSGLYSTEEGLSPASSESSGSTRSLSCPLVVDQHSSSQPPFQGTVAAANKEELMEHLQFKEEQPET